MIQINLFTAGTHSYRFRFTKFCVEQLSLIKKENMEKICFHIYTDKSKEKDWIEELSKDKYQNFDKEIHTMSTDNYMRKIQIAQDTECEYSIKWDDDVFINASVWDYMIENTYILNKNISMLVPILSNGMPSVDFFIKDFLTPEEKSIVHSIFLNDGIKGNENIWGCNFSKIQEYIKNKNEWDFNEYWRILDNFDPTIGRHLPPYMKLARGVHPARFSYEYNKLILNKILENKQWLTESREYYTMTYPTVYCCNNLFLSKTSTWKESQTLFSDGWDEGQLNLYSKIKNLQIGYIRNTCGIHIAYGCTEKQKELEENFITKLFE